MLDENELEQTVLAWLNGLGCTCLFGPDISPDGDTLTLALSQKEREKLFGGRAEKTLVRCAGEAEPFA